MKEFDMSSFREYIREKYYNINEICIDNVDLPFPECIYAFQDAWFYTVEDYFYVLRMMNFQLAYNGDKYFFVKTGRQICPDIEAGDLLEDASPLKTIANDSSLHRLVLPVIKNKSNQRISVSIALPQICSMKNMNQYRNIDQNAAYIRIDTFSSVDLEQLISIIWNKTYVFIDLTRNSGGRVQDMLMVLKVFCNDSRQFTVYDSKRNKHDLRISKSEVELNCIKAINFIVSNATASSAEIFILMIRSMYLGEVVGKKTMGKLMIQERVVVEGKKVAVPIYRYSPSANHVRDRNVIIDENDCILPDCDRMQMVNENMI